MEEKSAIWSQVFCIKHSQRKDWPCTEICRIVVADPWNHHESTYFTVAFDCP